MYFSASREGPLDMSEREVISRSVEEVAAIGNDPYWIDEDPMRHPGQIFSGGLSLPYTAAAWESIQRWSVLLTHIRQNVPGAEWLVSVDDHEIVWDEQLQAFDPTRE